MRLGSPLPQCTALHCSTGGWNIRCVRTRQGPATCRSAGNGKGDISYNDDAESGIGKLRYNKREEELPEELRGLQITDDGFLIDTKTGKVINEFGATRFDVKVRALRGELDPKPWVENTERNPGVLMSKLINFPCPYTFQVVGKVTPDAPRDAFVQDMVSLISTMNEVEVHQENITVQERLGGKYVSISVTITARAPEIINRTYEEIGKDPRVKMKF